MSAIRPSESSEGSLPTQWGTDIQDPAVKDLSRVVSERFSEQEIPSSRKELADDRSFQMDTAIENPQQAKTKFKIKDLVKETYVWPLVKAGGSMIRQDKAQAMQDLREGLRSFRDDAKVFYNFVKGSSLSRSGSKSEISEGGSGIATSSHTTPPISGTVEEHSEATLLSNNSSTSVASSAQTMECMGHLYKGEMVNGLPEGVGRLVYPSTSTYVGEFKDGLPEGSGTFKTEKNEVIRGHFKSGRAHGLGVLTDRDKTTYDGNFVKGKLEGAVLITYPSGTQSIAQFRAGHRIDE